MTDNNQCGNKKKSATQDSIADLEENRQTSDVGCNGQTLGLILVPFSSKGSISWAQCQVKWYSEMVYKINIGITIVFCGGKVSYRGFKTRGIDR
ncbi:hypothetical protein R1flu_003210 [Riccia fluitans]|uniref:Uncharacterized protein n=1 Tax=Riccia fluitans TaxID=41844 RepID=A0ABD1Y8H9_9MARC